MRFWIWFNVVVTLLLFALTGAFLVRRALREGRLTAELALFLATISLGWMEAVIDWGAFVYYSPDWPHYPTNWPIVRLIPILPLHIPLCYMWFFWGGATMGRGLARRLVHRYPRLRLGPALVLSGLLVGFFFDVVVENFFIVVAGAWNYTQVWGPLSLRGGTDTQWPIYMGFAMALTIAPLTYLLGTRNDRGEDLVTVSVRSFGRWLAPRRAAVPAGSSLATAGATTGGSSPATVRGAGGRSGSRRRPHWLAYLLGWVVVVHIAYGAVTLPYAVLRWTGVQTTVGTVRPYPNGPAWYDDDVTKPGDPDVNTEPTQKSVEDGVPERDVPPKVG